MSITLILQDPMVKTQIPIKWNYFIQKDLWKIYIISLYVLPGPDFKTNKNNPYYGIQMKYRIHDNSFANRAEIGIEYKSYKDISLGKLMEMNNRFNDEDYKKMKRKEWKQ